jgi:hypothetical protein
LTGWNPENLKGDLLTIISVLSSIIFTIVFAVIRYGFGPRVQKKLEKPEQEPKRRREHTKNLSTEVYEKLLQLRRGIGKPVPYTHDGIYGTAIQ